MPLLVPHEPAELVNMASILKGLWTRLTGAGEPGQASEPAAEAVEYKGFRIRPAPGGVSVAHYKVTAGTLGCLAVGRSSPRNSRLLMLSNNHVIANSNNAAYGDCICQPGPYDGGTCPADQIATLERFVPIQYGGATNYVDCATGWCWPDRVRRELAYLSGGSLYYFRTQTPVAHSPGRSDPVASGGGLGEQHAR